MAERTMHLTQAQLLSAGMAAFNRLKLKGFTFGGRARHVKSGTLYEVLGIALDERTKLPVVVYRCDGVNWTRPLTEFLRKFEAVHRG